MTKTAHFFISFNGADFSAGLRTHASQCCANHFPHSFLPHNSFQKRRRAEVFPLGDAESESDESGEEGAEQRSDGGGAAAASDPLVATLDGSSSSSVALASTIAAAAAAGIEGEDPRSNAPVTFVIERACLETVKTRHGFELLNCDDHGKMHRKLKRDPVNSRPDVIHQILLTLLDSPLNKSGNLQIYVHTERNVLFRVNPKTRIPRTYKRFAGLMVQLLHKLRIRASGTSEVLFKVVKNPVTRHLPIGARKIGTSVAGRLLTAKALVEGIDVKEPVVFVFGGMARGKVEVDYVEEEISLSQYPLSAACAIGRLLNALELQRNIL